METKNSFLYSPLCFNVFKPARVSSYDVVRHFKKHLPPGYGKIGHFGTLDPFASGVLMIAVAGASRLNDYVHSECPKTYLAIGKLGVHTETGDFTSPITKKDETDYLAQVVAKFDANFIEEQLNTHFLGTYYQAPHQYSAAKFEGRPLHEWARAGVLIQKEKVAREILKIEVVKYHFPYLCIRFTVTSGTYIRTLFSDCAEYLGTHGTLVSLVRESVGPVHIKDSIHKKNWPVNKEWNVAQFGLTPTNVLPFKQIMLVGKLAQLFQNGVTLDCQRTMTDKFSEGEYVWVNNPERTMGLARKDGQYLKLEFNFPVIS